MALFWKSCSVCRRDIDWHKVEKVRLLAEFFGQVAYGICVCGMEVENPKDPNYRRRVRRWKKAQNEARKRANSAL